MRFPAARYRDVLLAAIALVQCYATRTQDRCATLSYHATMAECRVLAYRRFDSRALNATGLPVVISYRCVAADRWSAAAGLVRGNGLGRGGGGGGRAALTGGGRAEQIALWRRI